MEFVFQGFWGDLGFSDVSLAADLLVDLIDDLVFVVQNFQKLELAKLNIFLDLSFLDFFVPVNHAQT